MSNSLPSSTLDPTNSNPIISAQNLGKMYKLYDRPVERLKDTLFWRFGKIYGREFWAVKDISFQVQKGEAVGIVGRNGSGKSTLLQIIAGVLLPTTGEVSVKGRVSALLELGSGFNPDYTGRENVYMSGALLGLSKEEMDNKFDFIADFADIGEFIDQPVKLFSSGMFARLAFSVAIAVDPDILIVDEILSVGDYNFQQKCIARMKHMRDNGLTLLFVSHSTDAIKDTCEKGLFLNQGEPVYWGTAAEASDNYLKFMRELANQEKLQNQASLPPPVPLETKISNSLRYGTGHAQIVRVEVTDDEGQPCAWFEFEDYINIHVYFKAMVDITDFSANFGISDNTGITVMGTSLIDEYMSIPFIRAGTEGHVRFRFINHLRHGNYGVSIGLNRVKERDFTDNVVLDAVVACATFQVVHDPERPIWYKFYGSIDIEYDVGRYSRKKDHKLDSRKKSGNNAQAEEWQSKWHYMEWTDENSKDLYDWSSQRDPAISEYFSQQVGRGVVNFMKCFSTLNGRVLDYGCGPGYLIQELLDAGISCEGMDFSAESVNTVNKKFDGNKLWRGALQFTGGSLPYPDDAFDVIFCIETIEHVLPHHMQGMLRELKRILRPGSGRLLITTPDSEDLQRNMVYCPECHSIFHRYQHVRSFTPDQLKSFMKNAGFISISCDVTSFWRFQQEPLPNQENMSQYFGAGGHLFWVGGKQLEG